MSEAWGVMGGTFDPIHMGHLRAAELAIDCAGLDRLLLVPSGTPPHRPEAIAPGPARLEMCSLAAAGHPGLEASGIELGRSGPSYTVDTLRAIHSEVEDARLHLVLGWDAAREIGSWYQPEEVLRLARILIVGRPGLELPDRSALARAGIPLSRAVLCAGQTPDIHATEVRRLAAMGASLAGLVPPAVAEYIDRHGLYRAQER